VTGQGEGRITIVVLDPDVSEEHSPLRRVLRDYPGELVTVWSEPACQRSASGKPQASG
jgi:hypothetical protein